MNGFVRTLAVVLLSGATLVAGQAVIESTFANKDAALQVDPALPFRRCGGLATRRGRIGSG